MVHNPDLTRQKERINAILVADLTPAQLDAVQEKFGNGANLCSPFPAEQLFIHDKRDWSSYSLPEMKRAMSDTSPLLVIDSQTPDDGAVWYIDDFASQDDVDDELAENTNTLIKIRIKLEAVVISYQNYSIANMSIDEALSEVNVDTPIPEIFTQSAPYGSDFDCIEDRYLNPTWVTASPDEIEVSTDLVDLSKFAPLPSEVMRLKEEVARREGLKCTWTVGGDEDDGESDKGSKGSRVLQCDYDPRTAVSRYERPEGSL